MKDYVVSIIIIFNILGFMTFPVYYGKQISETNPLLWIFVPDCQLSALFFAIGLLISHYKLKKNQWLTQLGIAAGLKYGFWTLMIMLANYSYYAGWANMTEYWAIIIAHVALMLEPLLIIKEFKLSKHSIPGFTFLILNDASDYLLNTHPPVPINFLNFTRWGTPIITLLIILISYFLKQKQTK